MKFLSLLFNVCFWPIKMAFSLLVKLSVIFAFIGIFLMITGNFWLPKVFELAIKSKTGFNVSVGDSDGSMFTANVDFKETLLENPRLSFYNKNFIDINEAVLDISVRSLFTETFVLENLTLDIEDISIVRNDKGETNVMLFAQNLKRPSQRNKQKAEIAKQKQLANTKVVENNKKGITKFLAQNVTLKLKTIHVLDESQENQSNKVYTVNYSKTFKDISDLQKIQSTLIRDLGKYGISVLIESTFNSIFDLPVLKQGLEGAGIITDVSKALVKGTTKTVKKSLNGLKPSVKKQ